MLGAVPPASLALTPLVLQPTQQQVVIGLRPDSPSCDEARAVNFNEKDGTLVRAAPLTLLRRVARQQGIGPRQLPHRCRRVAVDTS